MNKYECFYNRTTIDIEANTSYEAQQKAAKALNVKKNKQYLIAVVLIEKGDGEKVVHSSAEIG